MFVHQKVSRYIDQQPDIKMHTLGKEKCRLLHKGFLAMDDASYSHGVVPLTNTLLLEFIPLYNNYIGQKDRPVIADLFAIYTPRIDNGESLYFAYVRDATGLLLAGAVFIEKIIKEKSILMLGFRSSTPGFIYQKLHSGYYIESLFFDCGVELGVLQFSRGRDRNGYGLVGSNIGLCIHKLQLHFLPYVVNKPIMVNIDDFHMSEDCVFFIDPNDVNQFTRILLYTNDSNIHSSFIGLAQKRGLIVDILPRLLHI